MYETIVELKMELFLLPREDEHGVKKLMRHVTANYLDSNFENIISNITTVSQEAGKEQWWFGCLQSTLGDDRMNKVGLCSCVYVSLMRLHTHFSNFTLLSFLVLKV